MNQCEALEFLPRFCTFVTVVAFRHLATCLSLTAVGTSSAILLDVTTHKVILESHIFTHFSPIRKYTFWEIRVLTALITRITTRSNAAWRTLQPSIDSWIIKRYLYTAYIALSARTTVNDEERILKELVVMCFMLLAENSPGRAEEYHENLHSV